MIWFNGQRAKASERRTQQSDGFGGIGGAHGEGALPLWVATLLGSVGAAAFHALVVPLDTYKVRSESCNLVPYRGKPRPRIVIVLELQ